jgi:Lymphocystis disease virus RNA-directed DNA polymerase
MICLLFKKGDKRLPKNWRPISLLNTDYKILAKLLAARFRTLLPYLLSMDQNGFVAGRQLEDAVMMCQMTIDYLATEKETGYIVMLDQEKAFDRVDPIYLLDILRAYQIPEYLINWVGIIYSMVPTKLSINGQITESIMLKSGVRQGCPLSPLLFVLSIEPLANLIRTHPNYKGIDLPNNTSIRVGMFADDTCFYAKDEESILIIKEMTEIYANGSGGKANIDKTEILPIGYIEGKTYLPTIADIKVLNPSNPVRLLGTTLT